MCSVLKRCVRVRIRVFNKSIWDPINDNKKFSLNGHLACTLAIPVIATVLSP